MEAPRNNPASLFELAAIAAPDVVYKDYVPKRIAPAAAPRAERDVNRSHEIIDIRLINNLKKIGLTDYVIEALMYEDDDDL
jgi:hypothetical protein